MAIPTIELKHDGQISIATGASRLSLKWTNAELMWSDFLARLSVPLRTQETMSEYQVMPKGKRDNIKDVGGFVGGVLKDGRRNIESIEARSLITLDLDSIPAGVDIWPLVQIGCDCAAAMYSTHSSTPAAERLRVVIPLARLVSPDEYGAVSRRLASYIGIDYCDDTTYEPSRLMYWASCPLDADYVFKYIDAPFLDPDEILETYKDWTDVTEWPVSSRKDQLAKTSAKKQGDPTEKRGVLGAFCRVYDIPSVIDKYLPGVYTPTDKPDRWTYSAGSTVGGLILYEDEKFAFSHHGTDPVSGRLVNSFDLVRIHKFKDLDIDEPENTVITKLPSYKAMIDLAISDEEVAYQLAMDKIEGAFDDMPDEDTLWLKELEVTGKGGIANTISNVSLILQHDIRLSGAFYFDAFKERPIVCADLPWIRLEDRLSNVWSDTDDAGLRMFLEDEYKIESAVKIRDAVDLAMMNNMRHPVREYLESLVWDGQERLDKLFIRYLGAEDTVYTREVTRAALVGAVARIMSPGCKHDHMLVLIGPQGCRKSTTLAKLGKEWFSDSLFTMSGKDAYEQLQGYWIIELGEMAAARKSEVEQIKSFISKQSDNYRAAYARRTQEHPRQCAFFGSTNDDEFLRDATGARRFWPVEVDNTGRKMADKLTADVIDQIWAEAVIAYKKGESWYLSEEAEMQAREVQSDHTEKSDKAGMIEEFIKKKIPPDWDSRSLEERRYFWNGSLGEIDESTLVERDKICAVEIWCELFDGDLKNFTKALSREFNSVLNDLPEWKKIKGKKFGAGYGIQRGFIKK